MILQVPRRAPRSRHQSSSRAEQLVRAHDPNDQEAVGVPQPEHHRGDCVLRRSTRDLEPKSSHAGQEHADDARSRATSGPT